MVYRVSHNLKQHPNIFLDYNLSEKVVAITKIEGDSSDSTGVATTLSLTLSETNDILENLQRFVELFNLKPPIRSRFKQWLFQWKKLNN